MSISHLRPLKHITHVCSFKVLCHTYVYVSLCLLAIRPTAAVRRLVLAAPSIAAVAGSRLLLVRAGISAVAGLLLGRFLLLLVTLLLRLLLLLIALLLVVLR